MKGEIKYNYSEFEMIESNNLHEKKFEKLKEKRYKNRNRESILTYEMMVNELESINNGASSWILTKKKSEDDLNISNHIKTIFPHKIRENKSEEKDKSNIDFKIRRSILNDLNIKIKNFENYYRDIEEIESYRSTFDVRIIYILKIYLNIADCRS